MSLNVRFLKSCAENDLEDVKDCLEEGVYVNTVGAVESVRVPSEGGATWSGLTIAAWKDYRDLLDLLLSHPGIDVNLPTEPYYSEYTPLMFACSEGNYKIVRRLLQVPGINILFKDSTNWTAQHGAAMAGYSKCLKELAKMPGVEWNCQDNEGRTPLYVALHNGNADCAEIILAKPGLDFTVKTSNGETLTEAAIFDEECAEILAGVSGVDWNAKMSDGETPIMHCLKMNDYEMFEILVNSPLVDLNIKDDDGDTPIIFCLKNKEATSEEFKILLDCPRVELGTAINWALERNQMDIVKQLGEALESRLVDAKRKLQLSWRGRRGVSAGSIMKDEMLIMKTRLQLESFRQKASQHPMEKVGSNNKYEAERLKSRAL